MTGFIERGFCRLAIKGCEFDVKIDWAWLVSPNGLG